MCTKFAAWRRIARLKLSASNSCRRRTCKLWCKHQVMPGIWPKVCGSKYPFELTWLQVLVLFFQLNHIENQMLTTREEMDPPFLSRTGGKKRSIPFRRQRMQIDDLIPPSSTSAYPVSQPDDPYIADLLQLADGRFGFFCDRWTVSLRGCTFLMDVLIVDACISIVAPHCIFKKKLFIFVGFMSYRKTL